MKKMVLVISTVILGVVWMQGCETLKGTTAGVKKDAANAGDKMSQGVNAVLEADRSFAEKYW